MTKSINPGWPDPTDWAKRLHDQLETLGKDYQAATWDVADDPESFEGLKIKQTRAAEVLVAVCSALHELPLFEKSTGAAVLHVIAGAMGDVVMGAAPRLFKSTHAGAPGGDGIHRKYVKVYVVWAVRFLVEAHRVPEGKAVKIVTKLFSDAGATGRQGKPLSATTVNDWCLKAHPLSSNIDYKRINREVESKLEECRDDPEWPGSYDKALAWINKLASDPLLTSKYG